MLLNFSFYINKTMAEKEFLKYLGRFRTDRIRLKILAKKGKVVSFLVQFESFINEKWRPIVQYDTAHGFPHRDVLHPNGDKEKFDLSFPDLKTVLQYAEQDILDRWEWYKDRYIREMS